MQTEVLDEFLFADDMAKGASTEEKMQKGVKQISDSCDSYDLTISIKKTEVVYQPAPGKPYKEPTITMKDQPASVAQLDAPSDWRPGGRGFNPHRGRQHSLVEIDHEIFSTVILSLPLIQEGQLSVSDERMCTILVNCLED